MLQMNMESPCFSPAKDYSYTKNSTISLKLRKLNFKIIWKDTSILKSKIQK